MHGTVHLAQERTGRARRTPYSLLACMYYSPGWLIFPLVTVEPLTIENNYPSDTCDAS